MKHIKLNQGHLVRVDDEDYEELKEIPWYIIKYRNKNYAIGEMRSSKGIDLVRMHRHILGLKSKDGKIVDHINGDGLDNRRENLRLCSLSQNRMNSRPRIVRTSKYKGLTFIKSTGRWQVRITDKGRRLSLGCFKCEDAAATVYNLAALKYHGEFAWLNKV